jgi:hypothetical protein
VPLLHGLLEGVPKDGILFGNANHVINEAFIEDDAFRPEWEEGVFM